MLKDFCKHDSKNAFYSGNLQITHKGSESQESAIYIISDILLKGLFFAENRVTRILAYEFKTVKSRHLRVNRQ